MVFVVAVREIQARHVHACFEQPAQDARIARSRTDGANNFGMSKTHSMITAIILPLGTTRRIVFFRMDV